MTADKSVVLTSIGSCWSQGLAFRDRFKETLFNSVFVTPAQAGVQKNQAMIDSRLRGNDINQMFTYAEKGNYQGILIS